MSPEQAKGKPADKRSDVWAFGCVLWEMLTAQRPFEGDSMSEVLAAVLKSQPNWTRLPVDVPVALRRLLHRCVEKDPKQRLQAIGEARIQIDELLSGSSNDPFVTSTARPLRQRLLPWIGVVAAFPLALLVLRWVSWRELSPVPLRLSVELGVDASLANTNLGAATILSPENVFELGHYTGFLIRSFDPTRAR